METEDFLDDDFLRKLERLRLISTRVRKGPERGEHRSFRSGTSLEFLDYRKYQPGDDLRYVDWNVYGRLDKLFLKLFRSEEEMAVHLLIDTSRSMQFGRPPKITLAQKTAAVLGYIALSNMESLTLFPFSEGLGPPLDRQKGKKAYPEVLRFLRSLTLGGKTSVNASLNQFAAAVRPGLTIILSDFLDPQGPIPGLEALQQRKHKTVLIQLLDPKELHPDLEGYWALKDMETGQVRKMTVTQELRSQYRKGLERFLQGLQEFGHAHGIGYHLWETSIPFEDFVFDRLFASTLFS